MITQAGLLFEHLPDGAFDPMLGVSTGAAAIFGASGGVMEAALRTVVEQLTGEGMAPLEYQEVRGMEGVKEASYELPGKTVRVCVASGLHNVKRRNDYKSAEIPNLLLTIRFLCVTIRLHFIWRFPNVRKK